MIHFRLRILAATGAVILLLAAALILWWAGLPQIPTLDIVPAFEKTTLDGQPLKIDTELGHPLVINFWATWCIPCIIEMPLLEEASQANQNTGLLILGIDAGEDRPQVSGWIAENGISFPIVIDEDGSLERRYGVRGYPTTFFIDRQGRIQRVVEGPLSEEALAAGLAAIDVQ